MTKEPTSMSDTNITRAEAAIRSAMLTVSGYEVDIDLTDVRNPDAATFGSITTVRFAAEAGADTWIDLIAPSVRRAVLNGDELDIASFTGTRLPLLELAADNVLLIEADCAYMRTGEGLHRFVDHVDDSVYLYTQFEVADSRRMFASFEQPDLKATFAFTVTAPEGWQIISNSPTPVPVALDGGLARWSFEPTPPISTYITALVAGPYHVVRDEYSGMGAPTRWRSSAARRWRSTSTPTRSSP